MGATTAVFTVVDTVVFRPLAYQHSKRMVRLNTEFPTFPNGGLRRFAVSPPAFLEMREMLRKFKGPGLRGLAARAPYFHNGSAQTLADVVTFSDARFHIGFTAQESADLIAFLSSL